MQIDIERTTKGRYFIIITDHLGGTFAWGEDLTWKQVKKLLKKSMKRLL